MIALIVGGAENAWDDLDRADGLVPWPDAVVAVNQIGIHLPRVDHWVSCHPTKLRYLWCPLRPKNQGHYTTWSHYGDYTDRTCTHWGGGSGGLAVKVALRELKATHVVLAGMPLDPRPHAMNSSEWKRGPWGDAGIMQVEWEQKLLPRTGTERIRSLSGWTRDTLGEPTLEWLRGGADGHKAAA